MVLLYNYADHYVRLNWRCLILDIQHRNVYIYFKLMLSVQCSYRPLNPLYSITHIKFTIAMRGSWGCKCERQGSWKLEFLRLSKISLRPRPLPSENGNIPLMPPPPPLPLEKCFRPTHGARNFAGKAPFWDTPVE